MSNIIKTQSLLNQLKTITKSFEKVNKANGGNFNIFSVLHIETDEVRTHSRLIAELLSPNGTHGFNGKFLELFVKTIGIELDLNYNNCEIYVEKYVGPVTETTGGNIDILIQERGSVDNVIMIENKIYAGEQHNQLLRYHNAYPNGKLLYLTLDGKDSEQSSSEGYYESISYESEIIRWLEACKKEATDTPILRETLKQYINLIKKLTNQNLSSEMNTEIVKLLVENEDNFNSYETLLNIQNDIKNYVIQNKIIPVFKELKQEIDGFDFDENLANNIYTIYSDFCWVENDKLKSKNLKILFQFQRKNANNLIGGVRYRNENSDYTNLIENFKKQFNEKIEVENNWIYFWYRDFMNLDSNISDLKNFIFGNFKTDIKSKIETMLKLVDESF